MDLKRIVIGVVCFFLSTSPILAGEFFDTKHWEANREGVTMVAEIQRYHSDQSRLYILIVILGDAENFEAAHKYVIETTADLKFLQGLMGLYTQDEGIGGRLGEKEGMVLVYLLECICHNQEWK